MRYARVGVASWAIASVLVVVVVGVAWVRSQGAAAPDRGAAAAAARAADRAPAGAADRAPADAAAPVDPSPEAPAAPSQEAGAAAYQAECAGCHRAGEARGRSIPALRGHAVALFTSDGGREYLIDLMLDGVVRFEEDGRTVYDETHPAYEQLSNEAVAGILNYMLVSWGNDELLPPEPRLYAAAEVAARRGGA